MNPISILVLTDAGAAGRELLLRRDLDLGWALTVEEALAALERRRPRVLVTREHLVAALFERGRSLLSRVPVVVLLEPDGWDRRGELFSLGATALASAASPARIFEAIAELTGIGTRYAPRAPYTEVVDVSFLGSRLFLEAAELGPSGVSIREFPPAQRGDRVEVGLIMLEPPLTVFGMVTRCQVGRSGSFTEVAFNALDDGERAQLERFVIEARRASAPLPEPVGLSEDLEAGTYTLDLFDSVPGGEAKGWIELLRRHRGGTRLPRWLGRVDRELAPVERRVVAGVSAPPFARATLETRVELAHAHAFGLDEAHLSQLWRRAVDLCRALAACDSEVSEEHRAQIPEIRAGILARVYGWTGEREDADEAAA